MWSGNSYAWRSDLLLHGGDTESSYSTRGHEMVKTTRIRRFNIFLSANLRLSKQPRYPWVKRQVQTAHFVNMERKNEVWGTINKIQFPPFEKTRLNKIHEDDTQKEMWEHLKVSDVWNPIPNQFLWSMKIDVWRLKFKSFHRIIIAFMDYDFVNESTPEWKSMTVDC